MAEKEKKPKRKKVVLNEIKTLSYKGRKIKFESKKSRKKKPSEGTFVIEDRRIDIRLVDDQIYSEKLPYQTYDSAEKFVQDLIDYAPEFK